MSGGGGGGSSTTVQSIPDELKPLASAYTQSAIGLNNTPFQAYQGQRFADLTGNQNAGIDMVQSRAMNGDPVMRQANQTLIDTLKGGQTNPYLDQMVSKAQQTVLGNANAAAVRSGSFGNSGINEAAVKQMGSIATDMYGQAYNTDRANQMQALGLAPTFGNQAYTDANQLIKVGQLQQDQQQQGRDFQFQQFQERQNDPYKKLSAMAGVFGTNLGGTSTTTQSGGGK